MKTVELKDADQIVALDLRELKLITALIHKEQEEIRACHILKGKYDDEYEAMIGELATMLINDFYNMVAVDIAWNMRAQGSDIVKVLLLKTSQTFLLLVILREYILENVEEYDIPEFVNKLSDKFDRALEGA